MKTFHALDTHHGLVPASTTTALSEVTAGRGREEAFRRQNPQVLETLTELAIVQSAESSNTIEGVTAPPERIIELVQEKSTPENRPEEETDHRVPPMPQNWVARPIRSNRAPVSR